MRTFIIVGGIHLVIACVAMSAEQAKEPLPIQAKSKDTLKALIRDRKGFFPPPPETFLLEDNLGQVFPISSVPEGVKQETIGWFKKLVRPEWLPNDIESRLTARKDARIREIRDSKTGELLSVEEGDFIILDYEIAGYRFTLLEPGGGVTARIQMPEKLDTAKDPAGTLVQLASKFFTVPASALTPKRIKIEEHGPVVGFYRMDRIDRREVYRRAREGKGIEWWHNLNGYFDGQLLVIWLPEIPDNPSAPIARVGLPDRF